MVIFLVAFSAILACNTVNTQERFYISFERSGGFAGLTNSIELDSDTLSREEQKTLLQLIDDANFFEKDFGSNASDSRDQFFYEITITLGDKKRTISIRDADVSDDLRPLISNLSRKARTIRK